MSLLTKENFLEDNIKTTINPVTYPTEIPPEDFSIQNKQLAIAIVSVVTSYITFFTGIYFLFFAEEFYFKSVIGIVCLILTLFLAIMSITLFACDITLAKHVVQFAFYLIGFIDAVILFSAGYMLFRCCSKTSNTN